MNINFEKISTIYGIDMVKNIKENLEDVNKNIIYFRDLGFDDVEDYFERLTPLFICDNVEFINKINDLINRLGSDYIDIIENDIGILEELE